MSPGRDKKEDEIVAFRGVLRAVARMIDCRNDETGISQRGCRVMVPAEPSDVAVGNDDQWQLCSGDGTILYADESIVNSHPEFTQLHVFRFGLARIPDGTR